MAEKTNENFIAADIVKGMRISAYLQTHRSIRNAGPELVSREIAQEIESRLVVEAKKVWERVSALLFPTLSKPFDIQERFDYLELSVLPDIYINDHHISISGSQLYVKLELLLEAVAEEWNRSPMYPFKISFYPLSRDGKSTIRVKRERYISDDEDEN